MQQTSVDFNAEYTADGNEFVVIDEAPPSEKEKEATRDGTARISLTIEFELPPIHIRGHETMETDTDHYTRFIADSATRALKRLLLETLMGNTKRQSQIITAKDLMSNGGDGGDDGDQPNRD